MKAIFFALFLLVAAQAVSIDTNQYYLGFAGKLGFDTNQTAIGLNFFIAINETLVDVANAVQSAQSGDAEDIAGAALTLVNAVETLQGAYQSYVIEVITYAVDSTNATSEEELNQIIHSNFEQYEAQIIQQVAFWIQNILTDSDYQAGQTDAYILQILLGVATPQQIVYPSFNDSDYVPFDQTTFINEYTQAYFAQLGIYDQEGINAYIQCALNITVDTPIFDNFTAQLESLPTFVDQVEYVRQTFDEASFLVEACAPGLDFEFTTFIAPLIQQFQQQPVETVLTIAFNYARNLPEIEQAQINADNDMFTGDYTNAGQINADILYTIFQNVLF